jgi:hypothetical protein
VARVHERIGERDVDNRIWISDIKAHNSVRAAFWLDDTWECTIIGDRYGGGWFAFPCEYDQFSEEMKRAEDGVFNSDDVAHHHARQRFWFGEGLTPDEAFEDLKRVARQVAGY